MREGCKQLAVDHVDNVYVGEAGNNRVSVFTSSGEFLYSIADFKSAAWGLAFDKDGHLYVCDSINKCVVIF